MANVLVTGGAGFIGSHLVTRLIAQGHAVRVLDDLSSGSLHNLEHVAGQYELVQGDLRNGETCVLACDDVEFVFHEAAIPSVPRSVEEPQASHDVNVNGTFNLLQAAVAKRVKRIIYAASSSAYGDVDVSPKHEGLRTAPLSPYAVQKLLGEYYCRAFFECYGLESMSLRYFNVFGERQAPGSQYAAAIPAFVTALMRSQPPTVYGDGEQTRDFTYIDNVVEGNMLAMAAPTTKGEVVNVACGKPVSVNAVITAINRILGTSVEPQYVEPRTGDVKHSSASIALATKRLGFAPVVGFEEGLEKAIEYYRSVA